MKNAFNFDLQRFAAHCVTLADIITPELFEPYVIQKTKELSALYQSGIITNDAKFNQLASEAAQVHNMPFFEDLTGDSQDVVEGADLIANGIASNKDVSTTIRRAQMWSATDLSASLAGKDPMAAIASLVGGFWARDMQHETINLLAGVFAAPTMADHILDVSTQTGNKANISASAFIKVLQLLGDAQDNLTTVVMHSATKAYLKEQNLIVNERDSKDVDFDTYQNRKVVVDDGCPVKDGVFTTYIFGQGAIAWGNGSPIGFVATETDRDKKKGSGINYLINRKCFIMHPRGIAWQNANRANAESVSRAELADPTNWKRVYEPKAIRIVALKHKIG